MKPLWRCASLILLAVLGVHASAAFAQSYPSKPIRITVPFPPGGGIDIIARLIGPKMADSLNQPVLVENRPGASGQIGEDFVAKATPDGHTILIDLNGLTISPALYRKLPFDAAKDFIPVTQLVFLYELLVTSPKLPVASIKELIAQAKSKPGGLNYGHTGVGTVLQLAMEVFNLSAGIDIVAIPYKGSALVSTAVMTSEVDMTFVPVSISVQLIKAGRFRALGVTGARRSAALPDVPTFLEAGVTGLEYADWYGLFVPAKTPRNIVELIQREAAKALNTPDVRERILALYMEIVGNTPEEFELRYKADLARYARIVKDARIPLQN